MPLPDSIAARIGRYDTIVGGQMTGTNVDNNAGVTLSAGVSLGNGRDSLLLLAFLVIGIAAFSYWTR